MMNLSLLIGLIVIGFSGLAVAEESLPTPFVSCQGIKLLPHFMAKSCDSEMVQNIAEINAVTGALEAKEHHRVLIDKVYERTIEEIDKNIKKIERAEKCLSFVKTESSEGCTKLTKTLNNIIAEIRPKIRIEIALAEQDQFPLRNFDPETTVEQKISTQLMGKEILTATMEPLTAEEKKQALERYEGEYRSIVKICDKKAERLLAIQDVYVAAAQKSNLEAVRVCRAQERQKTREVHKKNYQDLLDQAPILAHMGKNNPSLADWLKGLEGLKNRSLNHRKTVMNAYEQLKNDMTSKIKEDGTYALDHSSLNDLINSPITEEILSEEVRKGDPDHLCSAATILIKDVKYGNYRRGIAYTIAGLVLGAVTLGVGEAVVGGTAATLAGSAIGASPFVVTSWLDVMDSEDKSLNHFDGKQFESSRVTGEKKSEAVLTTLSAVTLETNGLASAAKTTILTTKATVGLTENAPVAPLPKVRLGEEKAPIVESKQEKPVAASVETKEPIRNEYTVGQKVKISIPTRKKASNTPKQYQGVIEKMDSKTIYLRTDKGVYRIPRSLINGG